MPGDDKVKEMFASNDFAQDMLMTPLEIERLRAVTRLLEELAVHAAHGPQHLPLHSTAPQQLRLIAARG